MENLSVKQKGPNLGVLACIFMVLFITGLSFVISFSPTVSHWPNPLGRLSNIDEYFKNNSHAVLMCTFFQFGSAIPLAIFTATIVSRLQFLGVNGAGAYIALLGGFMTSTTMVMSSSIGWAMTLPFISNNPESIHLLYFIGFGMGGVGYSVPLGLLIAGIAVPSVILKLLPRWLAISGLLIALIGEISWLNLIFPKLLPLIPLTRFPGFLWLILTGFKLSKSIKR